MTGPPSLRSEWAWMAPALGAYLGCTLWVISLAPFWLGPADDSAYYQMTRNLWRYGLPVVTESGAPAFAPHAVGLGYLLAPFGLLPFPSGVLAERLAVCASGAALLAVAYLWLRRDAALAPAWAAGALLCLGLAPGLLRLAPVVYSDVPAALLVMAGVVMLRGGRYLPGIALLVAAYAVRTADVAVVVAALAWLGWHVPRRQALAAAGAGLGGVVAWALAFPSRGYAAIFFLRDQEDLSSPRIGVGDFAARISQNASTIVRGELGALLAGPFASRTVVAHLGPGLAVATLILLGLAAFGWWRGRLGLEAGVCAATLALILAWNWDPYRFLLPLAPFAIGGIALALRALPRYAATVGVAVALLAAAGDAQNFVAITPTRQVAASQAAELAAVYGWIHDHLGSEDVVLTYPTGQCYLYSGHPATRELAAFVPGRTYVVDVPYGSVRTPGLDLDRQLADRFGGQVVYRAGSITILRAEELRSS